MELFSLAAAIVVGIIKGSVDAAASHIEDDNEYNRLSKEKTRIEEEYKLQKKQAEDDFKAAKDEAERNAKKGEAEADLTDLGADITETAVSNDFNAAIDDLYLSQASDTWNWNSAAMQAGSSAGASYAALAGSGVRAGGSLSDAILMESSLNSAQLQFSQDAKRRSDNNNLGSVLNQLAGNRFGIYQNRYGADVTRDDANWLRNSYLEGGNNYNLYQDTLDIMHKKYENEWDRLDKYQDDIEENRHMKAFAAFFGGASQGASVGYKAGNAFYEGRQYITGLRGKGDGK